MPVDFDASFSRMLHGSELTGFEEEEAGCQALRTLDLLLQSRPSLIELTSNEIVALGKRCPALNQGTLRGGDILAGVYSPR
jgi:hypothetical protein